MDITQKSLGSLIDEICTCSQRCWHAQDLIMDETLTSEERLDAAIRAQEQNAIRSSLVKAIDDMVGQGNISSGGKKTYYTYFNKGKK